MDKMINFVLPTEKNIFVIGAAGQGKTKRVISPNIENAPRASLIINDPAGDLWETHAENLKMAGFNVKSIPEAHYNPLDFIQGWQDSMEIADILVKSVPIEGEDPSVPNVIKLVLSRVIYDMAYSENKPEFIELSKYLADMDTLISRLEDCRDTPGNYLEMLENCRNSWNQKSSLSAILIAIRELLEIEEVRDCFSNGADKVDLLDICRNKTAIFFTPHRYNTSTHIIGQMLFSQNYSVCDKDKVKCLPVLMLLDSVENIGYIPSFKQKIHAKGVQTIITAPSANILKRTSKELYEEMSTGNSYVLLIGSTGMIA